MQRAVGSKNKDKWIPAFSAYCPLHTAY